MPTVIVRNPDGTENERELSTELWIGRDSSCDLVLVAGGVSKRHARLFVNEGEVLLEDAGSTNGTYVDGARVEAPVPLKAWSKVSIGKYTLALKESVSKASPGLAARRGSGPRPSPPSVPTGRALQTVAPQGRTTKQIPVVAPSVLSPALPRRAAPRAAAGGDSELPMLRGLAGPWMNKIFPLQGRMLVGRVPGCDIQLEDESVSRRHAELEVAGGEVILRDLGSANRTLVNGKAIEEVELVPGDQVKIGIVELTFEFGDPDVANVPLRESGRRGRSGVVGGSQAKLVVAALLLVSVLGGGAWFLTAKPQSEEVAAVQLAAPAKSPFEKAIAQCRVLSVPRGGREPEWDKALEACGQARDLHPIDVEANERFKKVRGEKEAAESFRRAERAIQSRREDEAVTHFTAIPTDSMYFVKAKESALAAADRVRVQAAKDCERYVEEGFWTEALGACELYMKVVCQNLPADEMVPPPQHRLNVGWGRLKRGEWRPRDPLHAHLLRARAKAAPGAALWQCPSFPILKRTTALRPDSREEMSELFQNRLPDRVLARAMHDYWTGRISEARATLIRFLEDTEKAPQHATARQMRADFDTINGRYKSGMDELNRDDLEGAAETFREALELDAKWMKEDAELRPSYFRRSIQQAFASAAYDKGKVLSARQQPRNACKLWKLGYSFWKGNVDLTAQVQECTNQAAALLQNPQSCDELTEAIEFAVEGDGLREKAVAKRAELGC